LKTGTVIRIFASDTNPPKIKDLIIVGSDSQNLALIFVNTHPRIMGFDADMQGLQLALSPNDCPFLDHGSFADCSDLRTRSKNEINNILQKDPGRKRGTLPAHLLERILHLLANADTIDDETREQFGLTH
jgi:hypothetical protein